jgi:hypothetical protein
LGEPRLSYLERQLPEGTVIVGVDEHTALICDLDAGTAEVVGNGGLTLRRQGVSVRYESGSVLPLSLDSPTGAPVTAPVAEPSAHEHISVRAVADDLESKFQTAYAARDVDGCVSCVLELEQSITDWTADTLSSHDGEHARGILRGMITKLGSLDTGDPAAMLTPLVECLLSLRAKARDSRDYAGADQVRDALASAGVDVRDTPDGPQWTLG